VALDIDNPTSRPDAAIRRPVFCVPERSGFSAATAATGNVRQVSLESTWYPIRRSDRHAVAGYVLGGLAERRFRARCGPGGAATRGVIMRGCVLGGRRRTSVCALGAAGVIFLKNQGPNGTCGNRRSGVLGRRSRFAARPLGWSDLNRLLEQAGAPAPCQISIPKPAALGDTGISLVTRHLGAGHPTQERERRGDNQ